MSENRHTLSGLPVHFGHVSAESAAGAASAAAERNPLRDKSAILFSYSTFKRDFSKPRDLFPANTRLFLYKDIINQRTMSIKRTGHLQPSGNPLSAVGQT
jgi:hypothetical protein